MKLEYAKQKRLEEIWEKLQIKLDAECKRIGDMIPYIPEDGMYRDMGAQSISAWTNGFWAGMLWQMYHATGMEQYRETAQSIEKRLDAALERYESLSHDVGFMWLHTAVADYRLTGNPQSRTRGLYAANILAGRFVPAGGYIRAWNKGYEGVAIVDTLMNLPLLYWGAQEADMGAWKEIAERHADTAMNQILRPDGSSNHMVVFDIETGEKKETPAGQGYCSGSSWTRGQAWAIYGMALSYRYTQNPAFLDAAKRTAHYFCANAALNDYRIVIDFRAPETPRYYDTTAAVCAACGLLEVAEHVPAAEEKLYALPALRLLLRTEEEFCCWDPQKDSIVSCGSARYDRAKDREVPIIYGDYFFLEAVLRLLGKDFLIW